MNGAGGFSVPPPTNDGGVSCSDVAHEQLIMMNALLMQHHQQQQVQQHDHQYNSGSFNMNRGLFMSGAASAPGGGGQAGTLQPAADHHGAGVLSRTTTGGVVVGGSVPGRGATAAPTCAGGSGITTPPSRYESQKRRDWNTFGQYLRNSRPPLPLARCNGDHVLQFLRYLDQFGKTKVHAARCPYFGLPHPPGPCECPLRQAWGSLDALIGRLRAAFEEHGGKPESNPFGARAVRTYLREVRETQAKARGIAYEKKKRKRSKSTTVETSSSLAGPTTPLPPSNYHISVEPPMTSTSTSSSTSGFLIPGCN